MENNLKMSLQELRQEFNKIILEYKTTNDKMKGLYGIKALI
jgi:hypothetical protein